MKCPILFSIFLLLLFSIFIQARELNKTITVDGRIREYIIHLPADFQLKDKLPVIFAFHGGGGTAQNTIRFYNLDDLADQNGFIVVYPNAVNKSWNIPGMTSRVKNLDTTVDDAHFISVLLDTLIANYKADNKRVFCTGISRGAMFSLYLADVLNARITAIAPVCGGISQTLAKTFSIRRPLPTLLINGTADPLVKYEGGYGILNRRNESEEDADIIPAEKLVQMIVSFNHCDTAPRITAMPDSDQFDGCQATDYKYTGTGKVEFIKVINGGHTWPGGSQYLPKAIIGRVCRDFSASRKIFEFFMNEH